jgi:hypothetical protein
MWALDAVAPLCAVAPHQIKGWGDRLVLLRRASEVAADPEVRGIADQWSVRYAYVGPRTFLGHPATLTVEGLESQGGWRVVYRSGGVTVLERVAG